MTNPALDTHKFVTTMSKAGMETKQAEALADQFAAMLNERVAAKADIENPGIELKSEIRSQIQSLWSKVLASRPVSLSPSSP